jgi:hypothetical protein
VSFRFSRTVALACVGLMCVPAFADGPAPAVEAPAEQPANSRTKEILTDAAIVALLIAASIAAYRAGGPGPCGCPEDTDRAGHRCGKRSAHSRGGGWTVYCYASDITSEMIAAYRKSQAK